MNNIIQSITDRPEFRKIFIETFSNEPSFKFMLPNDFKRKDQVTWLVDMKLKLLSQHYYTLTTDHTFKGFSWWLPPQIRLNSGVLKQLKLGYWKAPFKCGFSNFFKMIHFGNQESRILQKYLNEPYWILDVIATDPTHQRSGLGGALMQPVFDMSKRDNIPSFVLTHNPRNVRFYEKYGFKIVIEEPVMGSNTPIAYGLERAPF